MVTHVTWSLGRDQRWRAAPSSVSQDPCPVSSHLPGKTERLRKEERCEDEGGEVDRTDKNILGTWVKTSVCFFCQHRRKIYGLSTWEG